MCQPHLSLTVQLTFDNLLSHCVVELHLSCIGLEHAVEVVRFILERGGGSDEQKMGSKPAQFGVLEYSVSMCLYMDIWPSQ